MRSRLASVPAIPPPVHPLADVREYFDTVVVPTQAVWVATAHGKVVALLALDGSTIEHLYVDPEHWGHGIGTRLLVVAKRDRPDGLDLWTFEANTGARRFYERHGFVATGSTAGDNEEGVPDVRYEWRP